MDHCVDCYKILGIQGAVTFASLAYCLYRVSKNKCICNKNDSNENFYTPLKINIRENGELNTPRTSINTIRLPKRKKLGNSIKNVTISETIKLVIEDSAKIIDEKYKKIILESMEENKFTSEQCISALSYEFVGVYGSERIQQADVELFATIFIESINIQYKEYVEFLIVLKNIKEVIIEEFEPKIMLLCLFIITSDYKNEIDGKSLIKEVKSNGLEISKVMSSITAISISISAIKIGEYDVYNAIDTIKAAIVRRSSRIRKTNK